MTADAAPAAPLTAEDLYHLPDDGRRYELVEGVLRSMPPSGFEHGEIELNVAALLRAFVREHRLGLVVVGDPGFVLARRPDTVLAPDVAFVRADRVPTGEERSRFAELAPDLAVEVVSPSDSAREVADKAARWLAAGVRLVWVVWPTRQSVDVYETGRGSARTVAADALLDGGDVLPGFEVPVAELFT